MTRRWLRIAAASLTAAWVAVSYVAAGAPQQSVPAVRSSRPVSPERAMLDRYCARCHNDRTKAGNLSFDSIDVENVATHPEVWEKAARKLRARAMPPANSPRPDEAGYRQFLTTVETRLDRAAAAKPDPGRTDPFRRLNRTEYQNAVRDLLALDIDVADLLPTDDASYGFDNVSVANLSPTLMERYLSAAQKVSRLAIGSPVRTPLSRVFIAPPDLTQEKHFDGMPLGSRGGVSFEQTFPLDGQYAFRLQLARDRNENVEGLTEPHEIELTLDNNRVQVFTVTPNRNRYGSYYADENVDKGLEIRIPVTAGPHLIGATFLPRNSALIETDRQPYQSHFNMDRHPRVQPAVRSVSITGPFEARGAGDTPSRQRIFVCGSGNDACAKSILSTLARRAYRRPVTDADLKPLLAFYKDGGGFEPGIEMALRALLASSEFLFRVEKDPDGLAPGSPYRVGDLALASRLSFFLWSSIPDEELMNVAERGDLKKPAVLERQVRRMLADPRAGTLTTNFASQWLYLRNLAAVRPDNRLFPDFDENLRQAFRRETELLFEHIVNADLNVTGLLSADYTFLNERLAKHYGIANVYGDRFRRVSLADHPERSGLLGHGSILTVTSYATRTSPVLRGKWVLDNLFGMPPPPPPPNVPPLKDPGPAVKPLTMRERMEEHRANPACASCHQLMDPAGLSMEHFDAIGRWRARGEGGTAIDATGNLPGSATFDGVNGLRAALLAHPDVFVTALTEKLLTYALGRGVDYRDAPAVRAVVRNAAAADYRFSSLILGITQSVPFQMRKTADPVVDTGESARSSR